MTSTRTFSIASRLLCCSHCGFDQFAERQVELTPMLAGIFSADILSTTASVYVCIQCGHLEWFMHPSEHPPLEIEVDDVSEATTCLACGATIPAGESRCTACGWSYHGGAPDKPRRSSRKPPARRKR